jgi:nicotinamidase-related amidase
MAHILPSGGGKALINVDDTALLLLDHQAGLFQTVKDITVAELRANVIALARIATLLKMPVITTASVPDGPNGPLMPEIAEFAPHAVMCRARARSMHGTTRPTSRRCGRPARRR